MATVKYQLSGLMLDEVSFVDSPANRLAKVVLFKSAVCKLGDTPGSCPLVKGGICKGKDCPLEGKEVVKTDIEKAADGVTFNIGFSEEGPAIQCVSFDVTKWQESDAENWLKIRKMVTASCTKSTTVLKYVQQNAKDFSKFRVFTPGTQILKALEHDGSFNALQEAVGVALKAKFQPTTPSGDDWLWVRDLYMDYVIFDQKGKTWQASYSVRIDENSGDKVISIGDKTPVEVVYQPEVSAATAKSIKIVSPEISFQYGKLKAQIADHKRRLLALEKKL